MASFLCMRLHGPLASWGDIAVGGSRPSTPHPSRSAVLGLIAAALGIRREDADAWSELDRTLGFASRTDAPGQLMVDYHTAQGPNEKLLRAEARAARKAGKPWHRPPTRREELAFTRAELSTVLSDRQYRADATYVVGLWVAEPPMRWTLEGIRDALRRPAFVLYLGRKSCALDLPLEPQLIDARDPVEAMAVARFQSDDLLEPVLSGGEGKRTVQWEGSWPTLTAFQTVQRRDRVSSRARWQFADREEHQRAWETPKGGGHVPEQD